ncbi:MAG: hypothetical protein KBD21_05085 [Candidatus Pacebacteria bacterium]|nr:hypothetical protein [Candidatus Paceibacterota bacterium]
MVTANTVLGKAAALAMLPALTLGLFAAPASAQVGVNTFVGVSNFSSANTTNMVGSVANSGGNMVVSTTASVGGNSGSSAAVAGPTTALADSDADVDVDADGEEGEVEAEGEAYADGDAHATGSATSGTGNGGAGGTATNVTTLMTGNATSEVVIEGAQNSTEIDIAVADDCDCDRYNEYYESASQYYASNYLDEESEYEAEDRGEVEEEWSKEEGSTEKGSDWESYSKEYVPVSTMILVGNVELSDTVNIALSGADSGSNIVLTDSVSMGGTSGASMAMTAPVTAAAVSNADVDVDADGEEGEDSEVEAEGEAAADGDSSATNSAASTSGNGGAGGNTTTDTLVVTGTARSFVGIVDASRHTVIRIQR